jgi:hypothetical protein
MLQDETAMYSHLRTPRAAAVAGIACRQALRAAQDLIDVFAARSQDPRDHAIMIENEAGEVALHLPFSEIFLRDFDDSAGATVATPPQGCGNGRRKQDGAV